MHYNDITYDDIEVIRDLQPDGWPDITETIKCYIAYDFCKPIKVVINNKIVGVGASIRFEKTGWLAHIIVHRNYRNKGIGFYIVEILLNELQMKSINTVLLIATEMGEPVYLKAGFIVISDYIYLKRNIEWIEKPISKNIFPYSKNYYFEIIDLDKKISGENRESLIKMHLDQALLFIDKKKLCGFYLPDLGEGLISASVPYAGIELMKIKYSKVDIAVIPSQNKKGIDFLKKNGFIIDGIKGKRMIRGKDIDWKPTNIFSRIGGNYG